jgi:hypothetical protein
MCDPKNYNLKFEFKVLYASLRKTGFNINVIFIACFKNQ